LSRRIDTGDLIQDFRSPEKQKPPYLGKKGEDYLGRLSKYIPAEIVGLYLTTAGIIPKNQDGSPKCLAMWIVFMINFALVPIYFYFATSRGAKKPLWPQIILASIAFPVWVFAIGGPFRCLTWYEGWIASLTLAFVTVVMGFYRPRPGS